MAAPAPLQYAVVDAFTRVRFAGNAAAVVVLEADRAVPPDADLQSLAAELNLSETVFVRRVAAADSARYTIRWFTPRVEVDLCGHATLAAAHVLFAREAAVQQLVFESRSGPLAAVRAPAEASGAAGGVTLEFPAELVEPCAAPPTLLPALGLDAADALFVGRNRLDLLVEIAGGVEAVRALQPDFGRLRQLDARCVIVTSRGPGADKPDSALGSAVTDSEAPSTDNSAHEDGADMADVVSRVFAPTCGIDEDPVTGSAHCGIGPFWAQRFGKTSLRAFQASPRGGALGVRWDEAGGRVYLTGHAVTVAQAELVGGL